MLRFAPDTNTSLLRWGTRRQYSFPRPLPDLPVARVLVAEGAYPLGSQWARNPVPPCKLCAAAQHAACFSEHAGGSWIDQQHCSQSCVGENMTACPPGMTHFPEPLAGVSGFYDVVRVSENRIWRAVVSVSVYSVCSRCFPPSAT